MPNHGISSPFFWKKRKKRRSKFVTGKKAITVLSQDAALRGATLVVTHKTCRGPQALCLGSHRDGLKAQEQARIAKEQAKEAADAAEQARAASKVADSSVKEAQHNVSKAIQHRKLFIQRQSATVRLNYAIPTGHVVRIYLKRRTQPRRKDLP